MTNDELMSKIEVRKRVHEHFRHLSFGFPSSFVVRHSSFWWWKPSDRFPSCRSYVVRSSWPSASSTACISAIRQSSRPPPNTPGRRTEHLSWSHSTHIRKRCCGQKPRLICSPLLPTRSL